MVQVKNQYKPAHVNKRQIISVVASLETGFAVKQNCGLKPDSYILIRLHGCVELKAKTA